MGRAWSLFSLEGGHRCGSHMPPAEVLMSVEEDGDRDVVGEEGREG